MRKIKLIPMLSCLLMLSACAEVELASHVAKQIPSSSSGGYYKVGSPYKIKGETYRQKETFSFSETGTASWYGPNFHGKSTANGETFDMYALTAAHKTLQMPSIIKVTNLENGRSVVLRVNDRGPFSKNRVLDVSKRAAQMLDFEDQGTAKVRIDLLPAQSQHVASLAQNGQSTTGTEIAMNEPAAHTRQPITRVTPSAKPSVQPTQLAAAERNLSRTPLLQTAESTNAPNAATNLANIAPASGDIARSANQIYVQAASFKDAANAEKVARSLASYGDAQVKQALVNGQSWYRVRLGPLQDVNSADALTTALSDAGQNGAIVIID